MFLITKLSWLSKFVWFHLFNSLINYSKLVFKMVKKNGISWIYVSYNYMTCGCNNCGNSNLKMASRFLLIKNFTPISSDSCFVSLLFLSSCLILLNACLSGFIHDKKFYCSLRLKLINSFLIWKSNLIHICHGIILATNSRVYQINLLN